MNSNNSDLVNFRLSIAEIAAFNPLCDKKREEAQNVRQLYINRLQSLANRILGHSIPYLKTDNFLWYASIIHTKKALSHHQMEGTPIFELAQTTLTDQRQLHQTALQTEKPEELEVALMTFESSIQDFALKFAEILKAHS